MHTDQALALHESLELHEMVNFKTLNLAKSKLLQGVVFDQELRALLEKDVQMTLQSLPRLQELYRRARFAAEPPEFRPTPMMNEGDPQ